MKYCVIGNKVMEHSDENGIIRHGTASFPGGRKVYISRRHMCNGVLVLGLNRFNCRNVFEVVPLAWIKNIRAAKTFKPRILELMENTDEFPEMWFLHKKEDEAEVKEYAQVLNRDKDGDQEALKQYLESVMARFYW